MAVSKKCSFVGLFNSSAAADGMGNEGSQEFLPLEGIEIPRIQRDYAQGRNLPDVSRIRRRFLQAIFEKLVNDEELTLDFVYGDVSAKHVLVPLDGQQRLTTLFLLHWYVARHEAVAEEEFSFLSRFSYETRYSAREFCRRLVKHTPDFSVEKLSPDIIDQHWMPIDWQYDPTIKSMLCMLDDIHLMFKGTVGLWPRLVAGRIAFYFLSLKDMGLSDELYIKMNSRGKPLTDFEHFKAEWERRIKMLDPDLEKRISQKIDTTWTDIFWAFRGNRGVMDNEFMRYFMFLCDVIRFKNAEPEGSSDPFDVTEHLFAASNPQAMENVKFIEKGFDCWREGATPVDSAALFDKYLTIGEHVPGKTVFGGFTRDDKTQSTDLFEEACLYYGGRHSAHNRSFQIGHIVLLYAFVYYLQNKTAIAEDDFARRIRIVVNLVKGSEFELRDHDDRMKRILAQVDLIVSTGEVLADSDDKGFNTNQWQEEHKKVEWLKGHGDLADCLFRLEDHKLLFGAIRAVGLDHIAFVDRFYSLFRCNWGLVDRALLTCGDYSMKVSSRFQMGSENNETSWRLIFRNKEESIVSTRTALVDLLEKSEEFTNDILMEVINSYLSSARPMDWRYYFIKYPEMHPGRYGMYQWRKGDKKSYDILMMWTEKSITGKNWQVFLKTLFAKIKAADPDANIRLGDYAYAHDGDRIELGGINRLLEFDETCIRILRTEFGSDGSPLPAVVEQCHEIQQQEGLDVQDRIELALTIYHSLIVT